MKTKFYSATVVLFLCVMTNMACTFKASTNDAVTNANSNVNAETAGTPAAAGADSQTATAEALVADLYKQHDAQKSPFFQTKNRALVDKYFTKSTADLIWKDAKSSGNEVGALDGDPLYAAQDTEIKNFAVGKADVKGDTATVAVTFTNFGEKKTVKFLLKQSNSSWKIDDIIWPENDSMVKVLKESYPDKGKATSSTSGEFEGKFTVGETSCMVKPVKMAFEVRWAKGSGVETFVFTDDNSFESAPGSTDTNKFVFDDENYNTGTFYRADGKSLPVKRAK